MSKRRTTLLSSPDELPHKDVSGSVSQQNDDTKRVKLASLSDTKLEDLPLELIESIFVRVIGMEVRDMHIDKSLWKEKADLVISRLRTVSSRWSNILTTNFFQNELHRALDRTEQTFRLEVLHKSPLRLPEGFSFEKAVTFKDELFVLCQSEDSLFCCINVYDIDNLTLVKHVIELCDWGANYGLVTCSVSNCLYVANDQAESRVVVVRITKEAEHKYNTAPVISASGRPTEICIMANGNIILWFKTIQTTRLVIYYANGAVRQKVKLCAELRSFFKVVPKANGNLVLVSYADDNFDRTKLTEINTSGQIVHRYESAIDSNNAVCLADQRGCIVLVEKFKRVELVDWELISLKVDETCLHGDLDQLETGSIWFRDTHYNNERNQVITFLRNGDTPTNLDMYALRLTSD